MRGCSDRHDKVDVSQLNTWATRTKNGQYSQACGYCLYLFAQLLSLKYAVYFLSF